MRFADWHLMLIINLLENKRCFAGGTLKFGLSFNIVFITEMPGVNSHW